MACRPPKFWIWSLQGDEYALDGIGCRPVENPTHPATHPAVFLPPRGNFLPALDNQGVAQPTLSLAGVARRKQPRKKLAHRPKRSQRRTALLVKLLEPIASESCCLAPIFPAMSLGLRKVTNALSHVFGRQTGSRRGGVGMLERCGLVSGSEGARAKPTGNNISASPPLST